MARQKRGFRWTLFAVSVLCFMYTVFVRVSLWTLGFFFVSGGAWYWLERRKTRELDALPPGERGQTREDE